MQTGDEEVLIKCWKKDKKASGMNMKLKRNIRKEAETNNKEGNL